MTKEEIAQILKHIRLQAGFTQKEAAERLGRKQQTLASWETGQSQPDVNTLFVLCSIYGVSVDEAFGFEKERMNTFKHDISNEALEVAKAYDAAGFKDRNMARFALGLPTLEEKEEPSCENKAI